MATLELSASEALFLTRLIGSERIRLDKMTVAEAKNRAKFMAGLTSVSAYEELFDAINDRLFDIARGAL